MTALPPSTSGFQPVSENEKDEKTHRQKIARKLNAVGNGRINCHLDVTLNPSATSTVIKDARIGINSIISPAMAMTAHGATAIENGIYVDTVVPGIGSTPAQATIHHASNAATDQTIRFLIIN